jgi:hypothetical protein
MRWNVSERIVTEIAAKETPAELAQTTRALAGREG